MKKKIIFIAVVLLVAVVFSLRRLFPKHPARPNIVLVVIDTLRADHLPFYGYPKKTAPFLSRLAVQGVVFENAYAASSWTAPATASIFTSLYPFQHGVTMGLMAQKQLMNEDPSIKINRIPEDLTTLPEVLRINGYRTFGVSDNANISRRQGFEQGFDRLLCFTHQGGQFINEQILQLEKEILTGGKYFLYVHYNDPHLPYKIPLEENEKSGDRTTDLKAIYDKEITRVDKCIRELYDRFGWSQNTLLIVTADHGEEMKEKRIYGHGKSLLNTVIHVPLLFFYPQEEMFAGKRLTANVSTMDILPTLISFLDFRRMKGLSGQDLKPTVKGAGKSSNDRFIFSHLHVKQGNGRDLLQKACLYREYKYIYRFPDMHSLFYLKNDPGERRNRFAGGRKIARMLAAKLFAYEKDSPRHNAAYVDIKLDNKSLEQLRTLGYIH
jgi:arylsulfatase A-like enzyme